LPCKAGRKPIKARRNSNEPVAPMRRDIAAAYAKIWQSRIACAQMPGDCIPLAAGLSKAVEQNSARIG